MGPRTSRLIGRVFTPIGRLLPRDPKAERRACEAARLAETSESFEGKPGDDQLLPLIRDGASRKILDAIREDYGRPDVDEWLLSANERGLIAEHPDGSVTLTPRGRSSLKLKPTSITVGLPARKRAASKPS